MSQVLELRPDQLVPEDVILRVDGMEIPSGVTVAAIPDHRGAVRLVNPHGDQVQWWMYPDTQVEHTVSVMRKLPASSPSTVGRAAVRWVEGVRLTTYGSAFWTSDDGRYEIQRNDDNVTECEHAHPVRITSDLHLWAVEERRRWGWADGLAWSVLDAVGRNKRSYRCPGEQEHRYTTWGVWDNQRGDYLDTPATTFRQALGLLADHLRSQAEG